MIIRTILMATLPNIAYVLALWLRVYLHEDTIIFWVTFIILISVPFLPCVGIFKSM